MTGTGNNQLPPNWQLAKLDDVAVLIRGVTYKKEEARFAQDQDLIPVLRATNITGSALTFEGLVYVPKSRVSQDQMLLPGDVVIASSSGSKDVVGKAGQVGSAPFVCSFGGFCTLLRPSREIYPTYFGLYFQSPEYRKTISELSAGSNINNIKSSDLSQHLIPIAPSGEQTRIVAKLEELLSDLDAGVAELKAAQKKLAQYRQSLLKAAVEGALTADWRTRNPPTETGAELLQRILSERRARWEAKQLAKFKEQGKTPPKDWQKKYPEPVQPDTAGLPELPEGWVWASLDQLTEFVTSGSRGWAEFYSNEGATFIRSQDIKRDVLDLSDVAFVAPPAGAEGARTRVLRDDLLLTITGANVGKCAQVDVDVGEAYVSQHVALMRPVDRALSALLHVHLVCKAGGRGQLDQKAYGAGKPGLNLEQVAGVIVPLPCTAEIPVLVDRLRTALDGTAAQIDMTVQALRQSTAQRQNILRAAFAGQLVPQDPNDEPASVLLERIRAGRAAAAGRGSKASEKKPQRKAVP